MATRRRRCLKCKVDISERHHNCVRCEECQKEYRRWISNYCSNKRRVTTLGTRDIKPHRNKDFTKEHQIISQELRRLGLRPGKKSGQRGLDKQGAELYKKYVLNEKVNK